MEGEWEKLADRAFWADKKRPMPQHHGQFAECLRRMKLDFVLVTLNLHHPEWSVDDPEFQLDALQTQPDILHLDRSCALIESSTGRLVGVFITEGTDSRLRALCRPTEEAYWSMYAYLKPKKRYFYNASQQRSQGLNMHGVNLLDGIQVFTSAGSGRVARFLAARKGYSLEAAGDLPFRSPAGLYAAMQWLESQQMPELHRRRVKLARQADFPGIYPGLRLEELAATAVGISRSFACNLHHDSGHKDTAEAIFWCNESPISGYRFYHAAARVLFDVGRRPCCLYMPPTLTHGSVPLGEKGKTCAQGHLGFGTVLMSKKYAVGDSDFLRSQYAHVNQRHIIDSAPREELGVQHDKWLEDTRSRYSKSERLACSDAMARLLRRDDSLDAKE